MSKEIENEKASSNGFSVSFPLTKEEEMGNKKASSNRISISFPMEAEMEKYDDIVKKLFDFILDRIQSKETENRKASSKGISMIRFHLQGKKQEIKIPQAMLILLRKRSAPLLSRYNMRPCQLSGAVYENSN